MNLPHLQVFTEEAWRRARELAGMNDLGVKKHVAVNYWFSMQSRLWEWGRAISGNQRPDGVCRGKNAATRMSASLDWDGTPDELVALFIEVDLVERIDGGGVRVKGVEKLYGKAWDSQEAERKRKAEWRAKKDDADVRRTGRGQDADVHPQDVDVDRDVDQSSKHPPTPLASEAGSKKKPPRKRGSRHDPNDGIVTHPPVEPTWSNDSPEGKAFRERLDAVADSGATYAADQLQRLTPRLADGVLVLEAADPYFEDFVREHYIEHLNATGPPVVLRSIQPPPL